MISLSIPTFLSRSEYHLHCTPYQPTHTHKQEYGRLAFSVSDHLHLRSLWSLTSRLLTNIHTIPTKPGRGSTTATLPVLVLLHPLAPGDLELLSESTLQTQLGALEVEDIYGDDDQDGQAREDDGWVDQMSVLWADVLVDCLAIRADRVVVSRCQTKVGEDREALEEGNGGI